MDGRDPDRVPLGDGVAGPGLPDLALKPDPALRGELVDHRRRLPDDRLRPAPEPVPAQEAPPEEVLENLQAESGPQRDQPPWQAKEDQGEEPEQEEHLAGS